VKILEYWQAQKAARSSMVTRAHTAAGKSKPLTVSQAVENYLDFLDTNRKSGQDAPLLIKSRQLRCRQECPLLAQSGYIPVA